MIFTLPQKTIRLWQVQSVLVIAFLCFIIFWIRMSCVLYLSLILFALLGALLFVLLYIPLYCKSYKFITTEKHITVIKGVLFKNVVVVPFTRIVAVKTLSTPILLLLKLKFIVIKTARTTLWAPPIDIMQSQCLFERIKNEQA